MRRRRLPLAQHRHPRARIRLLRRPPLLPKGPGWRKRKISPTSFAMTIVDWPIILWRDIAVIGLEAIVDLSQFDCAVVQPIIEFSQSNLSTPMESRRVFEHSILTSW